MATMKAVNVMSNGKQQTNEKESLSLELEAPLEEPGQDHDEIRAGDLCPRCQQAEIDYDGMLNLVCPECGFVLAGCFT